MNYHWGAVLVIFGENRLVYLLYCDSLHCESDTPLSKTELFLDMLHKRIHPDSMEKFAYVRIVPPVQKQGKLKDPLNPTEGWEVGVDCGLWACLFIKRFYQYMVEYMWTS